jgi:hypothetical protein
MNEPTQKQNFGPTRLIYLGVVITDSLSAIQTKPLVKDKDVYQLLSDAIIPQGQLSDIEKLKLINLTTADIRSNIKFPLTLYCDAHDSIDFFTNLDKRTYMFDCSLLTNTACISGADIAQIFGLDKEKGWTDFRNRYGKYGLHYFSIPLFNSNRTKAILITGGAGSTKTESKELLFLEKVRNKWTIYREVTLEII